MRSRRIVSLLALTVFAAAAFAAVPRTAEAVCLESEMVSNFQVTSKTQTSISYSWGRPSCASGAVRYRVGRPKPGAPNDTLFITRLNATSAATITYTRTGLSPGTSYETRVRLENSGADRTGWATVTTTTNAPPPGAPSGVTVTPGVQSLVVSWTAGTNANGYKVQWKSGSQAYDASARQATVTGTSHTITGLTGGTEYTVRVISTRTGASDSAASSEETGTPQYPAAGVPSGVTVTPALSSLVVSWTASANASGYKVQWKSGSQAYDASARQATVTGTSHTITGLTAGTSYDVQVIATRANAPDSAASTETSGIAQYPAAGVPGSVTATPAVQSLTVSWTAAANADGYKVQWKTGGQAYDAATRQATTTGTSYTITGLTGGASYDVQVIATRTNAADSAASSEATGTARYPAAGVPGSVTVAPAVQSLTVSWTAAANADGYKVQWKSGAQAYDAATRQATTTGTSYTITGLTAGTSYDVRVIATRTNAPDGTASSEATGTARYPAAGVPSGVTVTPAVGSLVVSWTAAANANGYKVQWKSGMQVYNTGDRQATSSSTSHTISSLTAGTEYTVRVIATRTNAPDSAASSERTGTAQYAAPGVPSGVTVTPAVESLTVTWTAATNASGYKVQWKGPGQSYDAATRQATATGTSHTITGLTGGTSYDVRVISTRTNAPDSAASSDTSGTAQSPPPGAPGGVTVTPAVASLIVSWNAVTGASGYKVQWKSGSQVYNTTDRQATASGTSHTITGLTAGTEYDVQVIATHMNAPDSAASGEVSGTPQQPAAGAPSGVTATPAVESLAVSWTAGTNANGYKVQWKSGSQGYDAATRQATVSSGTSYTITSLTGGTEYTIRVISTRTNAPDSAASSEETGIPQQPPPGVPSNVRAAPAGLTSLTVSWDAVTGASGYKVQWKSGAQVYDTSARQETATGTSHVITGLTQGTEYTVRVITTNTNAPDSAASAEATGTPTLPPPAQVTVAPAADSPTDSLAVSWSAVADASGYKVQWKSGSEEYDPAEREAEVTTGTSHVITGLDTGTTYTVRVISTHSTEPDSQPSSEATGTPEDPPPPPSPVPPRPETLIDVGSDAGETEHTVRGRTVTVVVEEGVPAGIELDLASLPEPATENERLTLTFSPVADPPAGQGVNLGPAAARTVVDVSVQVGTVPSAGVRLCLPVPQGLRDAAGGRRLLLLHYDGETWSEVEGSSESGGRVCASGIASFSFFAVGYEDTRPVFPSDFTMTRMVFALGRDVRVVLPAASGGDGTEHALLPQPQVLPPGLRFDPASRTLSGTPTEEFPRRAYRWTATDRDGQTAELEFTIEVLSAKTLSRARLKRVNEAILPELSRAMWGGAMEAVARRVEEMAQGVGGGTVGEGLDRVAEMLEGHEEASRKGELNWNRMVSGRWLSLGLSEGGGGTGGVSDLGLWGSGDYRSLLVKGTDVGDWEGEVYGGNVGMDGVWGQELWGGRLLGGLSGSWYESRAEYGAGAAPGRHEGWMVSVQPYMGWLSGDGGWSVWTAVGYGEGEVRIVDEELAGRYGEQKSGSRLAGGALGGRMGLLEVGRTRVEMKGEGRVAQLKVDDNGELIAGVTVETYRLRTAVEGTTRWGALELRSEFGARWDGGDGQTGAGIESGGALAYAFPGSGLRLEGNWRGLAWHGGKVHEWGAGGSVSWVSGTEGLGWLLKVAPSWGETGSGVGRLWEERLADAGSDRSRVPGGRVETEMGYGIGLSGRGVWTPYAGAGLWGDGGRKYRVGSRLKGKGSLALDLEAERRERRTARPEHGVNLNLRVRW